MVSVGRKARKYRKFPNKFFLEQRYNFVHSQVNKLLFIKRVKVHSNGTSKIPTIPTLFVYNHKSNIDAVVLLKLLFEHWENTNQAFKFKFVAKKELQNKKNMITSVLDLLDTIYLDRNDIRQQFKAFESQHNSVKDKYSIIIAPEGTRYHQHEFGDFKAGAFKLAFHNLIPIQPIVLYGTPGLLFEKKYAKVSRDIYVTFLIYRKPFDFHTHNIEWYSNEIRGEMIKEYLRIKKNVENHTPVYEVE